MIRFIKKSYRGMLWLGAVLIINALLWFAATPVVPQPLDSVLAQVIGSTIIVAFSLVFYMSTRPAFLIEWFGGLDRLYVYHRWLAILPLLLISIHEELSEAIIEVLDIESPILGEASDAGELAQKLFIGLIVIALFAKYIKYEHWRLIHRLLIIPFIYGLFHTFYSSTFALFSGSWLSIWMIGMALLGLLSSTYMVFVYQWFAFPHHGHISALTSASNDAIDIEITPKKPFTFDPGQFSFIRIHQKGIEDAPHPFSFSGAKEGKLYFTVKGLGDYSKSLIKHLKVGTKLQWTQAYGTMTLQHESFPQVWIAGGVGLTPFLANLRTDQPLKGPVRFYYTYRKEADGIHLPLLKELEKQHPNLTMIYHDSSLSGRLKATSLSITKDDSVFLCGPEAMVSSLVQGIQRHHSFKTIDFEAFSFTGTLVQLLLKYPLLLLKKIKA
jgi:predicted ferric reductase